MIKELLLLGLLLSVPTAMAANTELFYQPKENELAVDAGAILSVAELKTKSISGGNTLETSIYTGTINIGAQFGVLENLSLEARFKASSQNREVSQSGTPKIKTERNGIEDFEVGAKGFIKGSKSYDILYGARFLMSFDDRTLESNGDQNKFSGGNSAHAYLGFVLKADEWRFGTYYDKNVWNAKKTYVTSSSTNKIDYTRSGTFALFGEYHHEEFRIGAVMEFTNNGRFADEYDTASDLFALEAYGAFKVGQDIELIGKLRNSAIMEDYYNGRDLEEGLRSSVQGSCRIFF